MTWYGRLVAFLVVLVLVGCVQAVDELGQAPDAPYSHDDRGNINDRGPDM